MSRTGDRKSRDQRLQEALAIAQGVAGELGMGTPSSRRLLALGVALGRAQRLLDDVAQDFAGREADDYFRRPRSCEEQEAR